MALFDRFFGSPQERTLDDVRRDRVREQEVIARRNREANQKDENERNAARAHEEARRRQAQETADKLNALVESSPLRQVAEALGQPVDVTRAFDSNNTAVISSSQQVHTGQPYTGWHLRVNPDGSGTVYATGGWKKHVNIRDMTVADAERFILDAQKHSKTIIASPPIQKISRG